MRFIILSLVVGVLCWPNAVMAQSNSPLTVITDTISFVTTSEQSQKSAGIAMALAAVVPGSGHQYIGRDQRALIYITAEALCLAGAIVTSQSSARLFQNSQSFAGVYAAAQGGSGAGKDYWQNVGDFLDVGEYNKVQELNRTPEKKLIDEHLRWNWADESLQKQYRSFRRQATTLSVASSLFVGALVLNHLVSFVDVRALTMDRGVTGHAARLHITPQLTTDGVTVGLALNGSF